MIDLRTANRDYLLPNAANLMKSEDVPRLIATLQMIDEDIATIIAQMVALAPLHHSHALGDVVGLVDALAGKSSVGHNHGIGTLTGVDFSSAAAGQWAKFNGTLWIPAFIAAADLADKIISNAKLRDSAALSLIGRSAASTGSPADIVAAANDTILRRVGDALGFGQLTVGMVPDNLLTFVKLASAAIASQAEAEAGTAANKLMTPLQTVQAIAANARPGKIGQVLQAQYSTYANFSAALPLDDTIPTSTEGTQVLSQAITPASTSSKVRVTGVLNGGASNAVFLIAALFRGSTCIDVKAAMMPSAVGMTEVAFDVLDAPASAAAVTYSVRVGFATTAANSSGYLNGNAGGRFFGGASVCTLILEEILP